MKTVQISVNLKQGESVLEENIAQALKSNDIQVVNIYLQNKDNIQYEGAADSHYCLNLQSKELKGFARKKVYTKLRKILLTENPEVIICHRYKPIDLGLKLNKEFNFRKCLLVNHGPGDYQKSPFRAMSTKLRLAGNCTMIACSETLATELSQIGFECIYINNAIDVIAVKNNLLSRENAREYLGISSGDFAYGTIGRLCEAKDHETLIRSFVETNAYQSGAKLFIIGEGKLRNHLELIIEKIDKKKQIFLTGNIIDAKRFISAFDVFTFTSIREGLPIALLEAMGSSAPIIASDTPSVLSVVSKAGSIFKAGNSTDLTKKLDEMFLLDQNSLDELGQKAFRRALDDFNKVSFQEKYIKLVKS